MDVKNAMIPESFRPISTFCQQGANGERRRVVGGFSTRQPERWAGRAFEKDGSEEDRRSCLAEGRKPQQEGRGADVQLPRITALFGQALGVQTHLGLACRDLHRLELPEITSNPVTAARAMRADPISPGPDGRTCLKTACHAVLRDR